MLPLQTEDMRSNLGTWAVPNHALPALAHWMHDALPNEPYDPHFWGQEISTTYYDTPNFALRKARKQGGKYLTLRLRTYANNMMAISAKTEAEKFRAEASSFDVKFLPAHLQARLLDLIGDEALLPVVTVGTRRYAIEDDIDRFTLDVGVRTDNGKCLSFNVLEFKSTQNKAAPAVLQAMGLNPIKLSKFLWATEV